jgi:hypothetical protein
MLHKIVQFVQFVQFVQVVQFVQCLNIHKNLYAAIRIFMLRIPILFKQKTNDNLIWL